MGKRSREKKEKREKGEIRPKREKPEIGLVAICRGIIFWGVALSLFTPLIVSGNFFFPFVGPKSLYFIGLTQIIFAAWLILAIFEPKYRPRFNLLLVAIILFVAILILATIFGADPSRSFWSKYERMTGLLMWFHLLSFFVVVSSVFQKKEDWFRIFSVSIFAATLVSLISLFDKMGVNLMGAMAAAARGGATIGNTSFMGTYLLFNIFLALFLLLRSTGGLRVYSAVALFIIGLGLFLSDARAAQLSFLGGLVLLFFLYLIFISQKNYLRILGKVLLAGVTLMFLISAFLVFQPDNIVHQKFIEKTTQARLVVWEKAWQGFLERPLLGWGPENFDFVFTKYFNPCMFLPECGGEIWFDRAHNIIFDTLVTTGIIGFLTYLGIFASAFYLLWKRFYQKMIDFWLAGIFSVILISYFVQNLTVFDMINSYLMFFLVLGLIGSITPKQEVPFFQKKPLLLKNLYLAIILILFIFSFSKFFIKPFQTGFYAIEAIRQKPGSEERLSFYKKTLETSPLGKYQIRDFFAQSALESIENLRREGLPLEELRIELDFVSSELEKSIKEAPLEFRSFLKLGQIYNAYTLIDPAKLSQAEEILKKAIELSPTNQQGYWASAQTRLYQGRFEEALSLAEKTIELEPKLFQSHRIVIEIAKIIGEEELIKKKTQEAIKINPDWEEEIKKILEG